MAGSGGPGHTPRMRFVMSVLAATIAAAVLFGVPVASSSAPVKVSSVYDGDTLTLTDGQKIRLLQVDTPELGSGECYSRAAHRVLLSLVPPGTAVAIDIDPALDRVDRYGRLLRYVLQRRPERQSRARAPRRGRSVLLQGRPRPICRRP